MAGVLRAPREPSALRWLYRFADLERGIGWNARSSPATRWKLARTRALLDLAGRPDERLVVVLVAGTKGKGSTAAFLVSILHAAGIRSGLYTQPHLQDYRERIRIDGVAIGAGALDEAVRRFRPLVAAFRRGDPAAGEPTTFEVTTALAVDHFARHGCRVAVVEVGLGGRLDATNALAPRISLVATIGYDHTAILGTTLGAIAREKAGIARRDRPLYSALQRPSALQALRREAARRGARLRLVAPLGPRVIVGLPGAHQRQNAALAAAAARALRETGLAIDERAIRRGLAAARWPGRFERVPGRPAVLLDGAHDGASAAALAACLRARPHGGRVQLVLGMYRDKDARAILRPLLPLAERLWITQPRGARALPAAELARVCRALSDRPLAVCADVAGALARAREGRVDVCVTGSLALVGEARGALGLAWPRRLWPAAGGRAASGRAASR